MNKDNFFECFFVTDLHGKQDRYTKLFNKIREEEPNMVFMGGDLLPHRLKNTGDYNDFTMEFLFHNLQELKDSLNKEYPAIFIILGNDDPRSEEIKFIRQNKKGLFYYVHQQKVVYNEFDIFGYSYVPPTPFLMKDWEKHDIDFTTRPGCVPISKGFRTTSPPDDIESSTITDDIKNFSSHSVERKTIGLFHSPPYDTFLDRAGLDGKKVDGQQLDVHVGSKAIKNFIKEKQPMVTLHGHIHESTKRTGKWSQKIGNTHCFNGSHGGPELCLVKFNSGEPEKAVLELV